MDRLNRNFTLVLCAVFLIGWIILSMWQANHLEQEHQDDKRQSQPAH